MEVEFSNGGAMSIALFFLMAIILCIPRHARGLYFLSLLAFLTLLAVSIKLQSIAIHLAAVAMSDFRYTRVWILYRPVLHLYNSLSACPICICAETISRI